MNNIDRVLLVGHCGFDAGSLTRVVQEALPEATITTASDEQSVRLAAEPTTLLLINRVLSGHFSANTGIELIEEFAAAANPPVMMLISNFDDAQEQAIRAGARRGFGKNDLHLPETIEQLRIAAGS